MPKQVELLSIPTFFRLPSAVAISRLPTVLRKWHGSFYVIKDTNVSDNSIFLARTPLDGSFSFPYDSILLEGNVFHRLFTKIAILNLAVVLSLLHGFYRHNSPLSSDDYF